MLTSRNCFYHFCVPSVFQIYQDSVLCWLLGIATIEKAIILIHSKHKGEKYCNRTKPELLNHKLKPKYEVENDDILLSPDGYFTEPKQKSIEVGKPTHFCFTA